MISSNAVNGEAVNTNFAYHCAHTEWNSSFTEAWWRVDLGEAYNLTGIKIYNRNRVGNLFLLI